MPEVALMLKRSEWEKPEVRNVYLKEARASSDTAADSQSLSARDPTKVPAGCSSFTLKRISCSRVRTSRIARERRRRKRRCKGRREEQERRGGWPLAIFGGGIGANEGRCLMTSGLSGTSVRKSSETKKEERQSEKNLVTAETYNYITFCNINVTKL